MESGTYGRGQRNTHGRHTGPALRHIERVDKMKIMKVFITGVISISLTASFVDARALQYQPPSSNNESGGGQDNTLPIILVIGAVVTIGYTLFQTRKHSHHRRKQAIRYSLKLVPTEVKIVLDKKITNS